jgi:Cu(I)/Ag(I) efflux system membrane protein CusA/SilA
VQDVIATALGGEMVTTTVEGRERFGVIVRYPRELRDDPDAIARHVLVPTMDGAQIPLGRWRGELSKGAPASAPRTRCWRPTSMSTRAIATSAASCAARSRAVAEQVKFPPGYYATWSGQFEYMERAKEKMKIVVPVTLAIIFLLLYLNFRR